MGNSQPIIILAETQLGENIGMTARAMLNCGLDRLRLAAPQADWPNARAEAACSGANQVLDAAEVYSTLDEAAADCGWVYATSARPRSVQVPSISLDQAVREIDGRAPGDSDAAVVFGPESSGLDNESLCRADRVIHYPMNPDFNSLNLAQAVLLFSWEWRRLSSGGEPPTGAPGAESPAPRHELEQLLERMERELSLRGFFLTEELRPDTGRRLRTVLTRCRLSSRETRLMHGALTALISQPRQPEQ